MHVTEVSVERLKVTGRLTVALLRSILFVARAIDGEAATALEQGADRPGVSVEEVSPARGSVVAQNAGSPSPGGWDCGLRRSIVQRHQAAIGGCSMTSHPPASTAHVGFLAVSQNNVAASIPIYLSSTT